MWVCFLCVWLASWGGAARADEMLGLLDDMTVLVDSEVQYSAPVINTSYAASVQFDMRAMGPLYNSTHVVIDAISKKQAYPEGIVSVSGMHLDVKPLKEKWRPLLLHYAGPVSIAMAAALLAAILPLAGLFWCCCYWCRVGRRRRPFDRKYDACLKGLLAIILIALLTLFLFGVVCAFATDSQLDSGSADAATSLRVGIRDTQQFLNATQAHARWLLVVNYKELEDNINKMLYTLGPTMSSKVSELSRAVSVLRLGELVAQLESARDDLRDVKRLTDDLRQKADRLNTGLRRVKSQLLQTLAKCEQPRCIELQNKYNIGKLDTEIQYSPMPDVSELLRNVSALLEGSVRADVAGAGAALRELKLGIQRAVERNAPPLQRAVADTGRRLRRVADEISQRAGNASAALGRQTAAADELRRLHAQYGPYRRYAGLGAAAALLLITCLMAWGLMCGVCGKRPDVYGASDCCNKGAGSRSLLCGVAAIFAVGGGVALVLLVHFAAGLAAQRAVCEPLTEPRGNRLAADLDRLLDLEQAMFHEARDPDFNVTSVLVDCHRNYTIYRTLRLQRLYSLEQLRGRLAAVAALEPQYELRPVSLLPPRAKQRLLQLPHSGLADFNFDRILSALETNMTSLELESLAEQLNGTARSLTRPVFAQQAADLQRAAGDLRELVADVLHPLLRHAADLRERAARLRDGLSSQRAELREPVAYLVRETEAAERFLNERGPQQLRNMTRRFAELVSRKLQQYLRRVELAAQRDVGRCGPLSNAFNATRDAFCKKIVVPANGYWMSLAWCVLLFAPLLLTAQRLARLYLHVDPYPGPLVEAEYLYDAYADRDNVPLANAYKVEKRAGRGGGGRGRGAEGEAGGAGAGGAGAERAAALPPPADAHHARRYNDMAPKHWEEGPPRYHGPTEYERPPPYYYPGPKYKTETRCKLLPQTASDTTVIDSKPALTELDEDLLKY